MLILKLVGKKVNRGIVRHLSLLEISICNFDAHESRWLPRVHIRLDLVEVVLYDFFRIALQDIHHAENCTVCDLLIQVPNKNRLIRHALFRAKDT